MAMAPDSAGTDHIARDFDTASLVRTASWGVGAAAALFLAVLAGISESGSPRVAVALATLTGKPEPVAAKPAPASTPVVAAQPPQPTPETRRLVEQVRLLAADRDRLVQRVNVLERSIEDVTGSIRRQEEAIKAAQPVEEPAPVATAPVATAAAPWPALPMQPPAHSPWTTPAPPAPEPEPPPETTAALPAPPEPPATPLPPPRPPAADRAGHGVERPAAAPEAPARQANLAPRPEQPPSRPSYGVDLGGAVSIDRLRMLWQSLRTNEPRLLTGLRPITHVRETRRGGRPDMRLIAGPLPSADDAAKLCAAILSAGRYCEPALFHGQRLLR